MTDMEYRSYISVLEQMKLAFIADPQIAAWKADGCKSPVMTSPAESRTEQEVISYAAGFMGVLENTIDKGKKHLSEKPGVDFDRPVLTDANLDGLRFIIDRAPEIFGNQEENRYERVKNDSGLQLAANLAVAGMSAGVISEKLDAVSALLQAQEAGAASVRARAAHIGLRNQLLSDIRADEAEREVLAELEPDVAMETAAAAYGVKISEAEKELEAVRAYKKGLEERKYVIPTEIKKVDERMQEESAHRRALQVRKAELKSEELALKADLVVLDKELQSDLRASSDRTEELNGIIAENEKGLNAARAELDALEEVEKGQKTKAQIEEEKAALLKLPVDGKSYTLEQYMKDREERDKAFAMMDRAKKALDKYKAVEGDAKAQKLFDFTGKTGGKLIRESFRNAPNCGNINALLEAHDFVQEAYASAPRLMKKPCPDFIDHKFLGKALESYYTECVRNAEKVNDAFYGKLGRGKNDDRTKNATELQASLFMKAYDGLLLQEAAQANSEQLDSDRTKLEFRISSYEAVLRESREELARNTEEGLKQAHEKKVLAVGNKLQENAAEQEKVSGEIGMSVEAFHGMKALRDKLRTELLDANYEGAAKKVAAAEKKLDTAQRKANACMSLREKLDTLAYSRRALRAAEEKTVSLADEKNFTADHKPSLNGVLEILDTKLNSYTKPGWKPSDNSAEFTRMQTALADFRKAAADKKTEQPTLISMAEHLRDAALEYRAAKEAQHFRLFPSTQRINRLQATDALIRFSDSFVQSSRALDVRPVELRDLMQEKGVCRADLEKDFANPTKAAILELREKLDEPVSALSAQAERAQLQEGRVRQPANDGPVMQ